MSSGHHGEPMKLSPELADVVRRKVDTRVNCLKKVVAYINKNNLRNPLPSSHYFLPDEKLAKVNLQLRKFMIDSELRLRSYFLSFRILSKAQFEIFKTQCEN